MLGHTLQIVHEPSRYLSSTLLPICGLNVTKSSAQINMDLKLDKLLNLIAAESKQGCRTEREREDDI